MPPKSASTEDSANDGVVGELSTASKVSLAVFRLVAFAVDFALFGLPIMYAHKEWRWPMTDMQAITLIALSFFVLLGVLEWRFGSTPGKLLMHLRVVDAAGRYPTLFRAVVRRCALAIDLLFGGLIGFVSFAVTKRGQRLGDVWTNTYVRIKVRKWRTAAKAT